MASVSLDDLGDMINVSSAEVPDAKVLKIVKHAKVMLELEAERVFSIQIQVWSLFSRHALQFGLL